MIQIDQPVRQPLPPETVINLPRQILVPSEMPQERNLPQCSPRENDLVEDFRDTLDGYRFA